MVSAYGFHSVYVHHERLLTNVFVPDLWMLLRVVGKHHDTLFRVQVNNRHANFFQPLNTALKVDRFSDDNGPDTELPNEATAIPARRKCCYHDCVAIVLLPASLSKCVGLTMY